MFHLKSTDFLHVPAFGYGILNKSSGPDRTEYIYLTFLSNLQRYGMENRRSAHPSTKFSTAVQTTTYTT